MDKDRLRIVLVEDNEADVFLVETALEQAGLPCSLRVCPDGGSAIDWIGRLDRTEEAPPDLLLLDLNLPQYSGEEILTRYRQSEKCAGSPVIVMSSSVSPKERSLVESMGAAFFAKPTELNQFMQLAGLVYSVLNDADSRLSAKGA